MICVAQCRQWDQEIIQILRDYVEGATTTALHPSTVYYMLSCTTLQSCKTVIATTHRSSQMCVLFIFPTLLFPVCMQFSYQTSPLKYEAWTGKILASPLIPCCYYMAPRSECNFLSGGGVGKKKKNNRDAWRALGLASSEAILRL